MALLTYFGANWLLVIVVVLAVAIVGACAFFLKNWKLAVATVALIVFGLLYQNAVTSGIKIQMAKDADDKVKALTGRIQTLNELADADAKKAEEDAKRISELEALANATPKNDAPCLDRDAARRVLRIR